MITTFPHTFFAYLDLLGFSQFVLGLADGEESKADPQQKQQILIYYYNVLEPLVNGSIFARPQPFSPEQILEQRPPISTAGAQFSADAAQLNSLIVSDSIFLWTDTQSLGSLLMLIEAIKHIIRTNFLWDFGFPLRGGIAMGSVSFQRVDWRSPKINSISTIVGDALVKAAMLEKSQEWAGCIVDDDILEMLEARPNISGVYNSLLRQKAVARYPVPVKPRISQRDYCAVVWPEIVDHSVGGEFYERPVRATFERNGPITDPSVQKKLDNTLAFIQGLSEMDWGST